MAAFSLRNIKRIAASIEVAPTKTTDAFWDAICKVAALRLDDSALCNELLREAMLFVECCRESGEPWKLKERRDLERKQRELAEFLDEVGADELQDSRRESRSSVR